MKKWICACLAALLLCPAMAMAESEQTTVLKGIMASAGVKYLSVMGNGIAGLATLGGEECLTVFGFDGRQTMSVPVSGLMMEGVEQNGLAACTEDGQGGLFALFSVDETTDEPMTCLVRLNSSGECLWSSLFVQQVNWGWVHLAQDGAGGVYLIHASLDDHTAAIVRRFSAEGEVQWKKLLRAEGLVWKPFVALAEGEGSCRVYGTAVSASEGIYKALAVDIDPQGNIARVEARDFAFRPDYTAQLVYEPTEKRVRLVSQEDYLDTTNTDRINEPFISLDECAAPACTLEDADASVH